MMEIRKTFNALHLHRQSLRVSTGMLPVRNGKRNEFSTSLCTSQYGYSEFTTLKLRDAWYIYFDQCSIRTLHTSGGVRN